MGGLPNGPSNAADGAEVWIVSVELAEPLAAGVTEAGFMAQVGASGGTGSTAQVKATVLLNPFTELSIMLEVELPPAFVVPGVSEDADIVKSGAVELKVAVTS